MKTLIFIFGLLLLTFCSYSQISINTNSDVKIGNISNLPTAKLDIEGITTGTQYVFKVTNQSAPTGFFGVRNGTNDHTKFLPTFVFTPDATTNFGFGGAFEPIITPLNDVLSTKSGSLVIAPSLVNTGGLGKLSNMHILTVRNADEPYFMIKASGVIQLNKYTSGTLTTDATGNISVSDARLKTVLKTLDSGLEMVLNLNPIYYKWTNESGFNTDFIELGFLAQEVKAVIPEAVPLDEKDTELLNYSDRAIIAVLVKAIQEQNDVITKLKEKIELISSSLVNR